MLYYYNLILKLYFGDVITIRLS